MKGEERKEFLKEYKMSLISGSILTVSPSLAGILLWNRLPEKKADGSFWNSVSAFADPSVLRVFYSQ